MALTAASAPRKCTKLRWDSVIAALRGYTESPPGTTNPNKTEHRRRIRIMVVHRGPPPRIEHLQQGSYPTTLVCARKHAAP